MSVVINTNVDALKVQNILTSSTNKLSQSMQRMSSGLKINSAADDAAGTVISARMNVQLNGNQTCQKNVQNANAMLSTAEGNIDVVLENVSRIRDLTLQAKNGTYSKEEKAAVQQEVNERILEINRVSDSAKFSQLQLFGGELAENGITFQVGANSTSNDTIAIDPEKGVFDSVNFYDILTLTTPAQEAVDYPGLTSKQVADVKDNKAAIDTVAAESTKDNIYYDKAESAFYQIQNTGTTEDPAYTAVKLAKIDSASVDTTTLTANEGPDEDTAGTAKQVYYNDKTKGYYICLGASGDPAKYNWVTLSSSQFAADKAASEASKTHPFTEGSFDLATMTAGEVDKAGSFAQAIQTLDEAIDNLTARKSAIGSAQSRLNSALSTLTTQYTNLSSAKSIITDADIASEASTYTQNQILQQVSTSLLAQANQAPSVALSLI